MEYKNHFINDKPFESKMIIIYLIEKMELPMPLSKIQAFILESNFMDYYALSEYMTDLLETGHLKISEEKFANEHTYTVTEKGKEAIDYFKGHINDYAKIKIAEYVKNNKVQLRDRLAIYSSFEEAKDGCRVVCGAKEEGKEIFEIRVKVSSPKYAQRICDRWKDNYSEIYMDFMNRMMINKRVRE